MHFSLIRLIGSMKISLSSNEICENSYRICHEIQKLLYAPKGRQKLWHQLPYQFWKMTNQSLWQTLKHSIYIRTVTSKSIDFVRSHFGKMNLWAVEHYFFSLWGTSSTTGTTKWGKKCSTGQRFIFQKWLLIKSIS